MRNILSALALALCLLPSPAQAQTVGSDSQPDTSIADETETMQVQSEDASMESNSSSEEYITEAEFPDAAQIEAVTETDETNNIEVPVSESPASTQNSPISLKITPIPAAQYAQRSGKADTCDEAFTYPSAIMRRAETAYTKRKYSAVIDALKPIYENLRCVDDPDTIIEIDLLLAVSHLETGNPAVADTLFLDVLRTDPDYDPVGAIIVLPASSTQRIEALRDAHSEELDALRPEKSRNTVVETLFVQGESEFRPYWLNFLPFGAGLFMMHENAWGATYASTQLSGLIMTILGGAMVEANRQDNYLFSHEGFKHAKNWQIVQITGIVLLATSYITNIIHALVIYEPAPVSWQSPTKIPPSVAAAPVLLPDGAGIGFQAIF